MARAPTVLLQKLPTRGIARSCRTKQLARPERAKAPAYGHNCYLDDVHFGFCAASQAKAPVIGSETFLDDEHIEFCAARQAKAPVIGFFFPYFISLLISKSSQTRAFPSPE